MPSIKKYPNQNSIWKVQILSTVVNAVNKRPVTEIMHNAVSLSGRSHLVDGLSGERDCPVSDFIDLEHRTDRPLSEIMISFSGRHRRIEIDLT